MIIEDVFQDREKGRLKEISRVKQSINKLSATVCNVEDRFFQNQIDFDTYQKAKERYQEEKLDLEKKLETLETSAKQFFDHLTRTLSLIENLDSFYIKASLENKKKLLMILFPEKLIFENGQYRTSPDNIFISVMITQLRSYEEGKLKKTDVSASLSRLAPLMGKISKLFHDDVLPRNRTVYIEKRGYNSSLILKK